MMILRHILTENENGKTNMAIDWHILSEGIPALHTFTWHPPTISIGYLQDTKGLNMPFIEEKGFIVARRPTGGKAVVHIGDISIAIFLPAHMLPRKAKEAYSEMSDLLREALYMLTHLPFSRTKEDAYQNHEGCFTSSTGYEIGIDGEKVAGIAVRKTRKGMLMHASIRMNPFPGYASNFFVPTENMKGTYIEKYGKSFTATQLHETLLMVLSDIYDIQPTPWNIDTKQITEIYYDKVNV